jgi:hypothetical protein
LEHILHMQGNMRCTIGAAEAYRQLSGAMQQQVHVMTAAELCDCINMVPAHVGIGKFTYIYAKEERIVDQLYAAAGRPLVDWVHMSQAGLRRLP